MVVHRQPPRESLLPGEARDSDVLDDAEHWSAVYDELIAFLRRVRLDGSAIERFGAPARPLAQPQGPAHAIAGRHP
jgi:hypothetical protein